MGILPSNEMFPVTESLNKVENLLCLMEIKSPNLKSN